MKTVFLDIDSQLDFLYPGGALYAKGAERIVPAIARLNRFATISGTPLISTTDAHTENDPEFATWPHHCVAGCWGQRKAESTLIPQRVLIPNRECSLSIEGAKQIIVEKQTVNAFDAPNFGRIIEHLQAERFVVYGVVTEICVYHAVHGLRTAGKQVTVVTDAIQALKAEDSARVLEEMRASGVSLALLQDVVKQ